MKIIILTVCIFITFINSAHSGEMYICTDRDGNRIATDSPQDGMKCNSLKADSSDKNKLVIESQNKAIKPSNKYSLSAQDRLKSCDPNTAIHAAEEIINDPAVHKEPLELFAPAFVLFQNGKKDEAVFWYSAAELRVRYQLSFEKGDRGQLLTVMRMTVGPPILNYAFQDVSNYARILDRVLQWDRKTPNPFRGKHSTEKVSKEIEQIYKGMSDYKAKLIAEKSDLEAKARKAAPEMERAYMNKNNGRCREGQLDPAYADQERKKEWSLVRDFVKNNKEVIDKAKGIREVYQYESKRKKQDVLPYTYVVSVYGLDKQPWDKDFKAVYVAVDVSRQNGIAKFSVACFLPSSSRRGPDKTECER